MVGISPGQMQRGRSKRRRSKLGGHLALLGRELLAVRPELRRQQPVVRPAVRAVHVVLRRVRPHHHRPRRVRHRQPALAPSNLFGSNLCSVEIPVLLIWVDRARVVAGPREVEPAAAGALGRRVLLKEVDGQ